MKNVLYIRTDLGTQDLVSGGSVTHTIGVIDALVSQGTSVYCASSAMQFLLKKKSTITFKALVMPKVFQILGFKINCLISNVWFLVSIIFFTQRVPITHIYQRYSMLNMVGIVLAKYKRIPLILEFNGSEAWVDAHWSPHKKVRANWLVMLFEQWNVQHADYIIVVSQVLKDMLIKQGVHQKKILVNPNGVDTKLFDPKKYNNKRIALRTKYRLQDTYVFGFIGTFSYWHGIDIISQMIPRIVALQPGAHFVLIGSGPLKDRIQKELQCANVSKNVIFIGNVSSKQAPDYLSMCDAYLCPSQPNKDGTPFFGSPTKLFEYMGMAKPIIASNVDQLKDIIDPLFGILVDHDDVNGFVAAAQKLMVLDVHEREKMGCYARQKAIEHFSWQQHIHAIKRFTA